MHGQTDGRTEWVFDALSVKRVLLWRFMSSGKNIIDAGLYVKWTISLVGFNQTWV
jgi:hypothetical protein